MVFSQLSLTVSEKRDFLAKMAQKKKICANPNASETSVPKISVHFKIKFMVNVLKISKFGIEV